MKNRLHLTLEIPDSSKLKICSPSRDEDIAGLNQEYSMAVPSNLALPL